MNRITLNNGIEMPLVGLGTYQLSSEDAQTSTLTPWTTATS